MRLRISVKVVGSKLDKFGGGMIGKRKGSGESDGENLERMRSISINKLVQGKTGQALEREEMGRYKGEPPLVPSIYKYK